MKKYNINNDICINPITGRKITEKGDVYKKYLKKCNILNQKAIKIQKIFLKKFNVKKKSIQGGQFINKDSCIEKINNELVIDNKIKLIKQFGTLSRFSINYICSFIDDEKFKFSAKIQINSKMAYKELEILEKLYPIRLETTNIHFPIIYGNIECPISKINNRNYLPEFLKKDTKNGYLIIFNELLEGDLSTYLYNIALNNYDLWLNAIEQIYMCIASLHSVGFMHSDSHDGNFLYKKIHPGGYFHYKINEKNYYIPNLGYIWVIWDFGVCGPIVRHYDYIEDYNLINLYLRYDNPKMITKSFKQKFSLDGPNKPHRNYGYINKYYLSIPKKIQSLIQILWLNTGKDDNMANIIANFERMEMSENIWFEYLAEYKILFNHHINDKDIDIVNSTTINFQKIYSTMIVNYNGFKINAVELFKKYDDTGDDNTGDDDTGDDDTGDED